jgi:hypothetical protein
MSYRHMADNYFVLRCIRRPVWRFEVIFVVAAGHDICQG